MISLSPQVSFIVPNFNEDPDILLNALKSVANQSYPNFECIVVDESTDKASADACRNFCNSDPRFKYFYPDSKLGLAASLNFGLRIARGEWAARFDSDDFCLPDRIKLQMEYLVLHPEIDLLGTGLEIMDAHGNTIAERIYPKSHKEIEWKMHFTTSIAHPTVIYRRQSIIDEGGYDSYFLNSEDLDLWLRLLNRGLRFGNLSQTLVRYRQQNLSRQRHHWVFNLKARIKNFSRRSIFYRSLGVLAIGIWLLVPLHIQGLIFKRYIIK